MLRAQRYSRRSVLHLLAIGSTVALSSCAGGTATTSQTAATPVAPTPASSSTGQTSATTGAVAGAAVAPVSNATLVYYNWFTPTDPQSQVFPHALTLFTQQHPGVKISNNVVAGGLAPLEAKLEVLIAGGTPPDVSALNPQLITPLFSKNLLADLTPDIQRDAKLFDPSDFFPETLTRVVKNGKQYAIPLQMGLFVIIFNRTLFKAAGVAEPADSWTWASDFVEAARKVTSTEKRQFGAIQPPMEPPIWSYGGDVLSADGKTCLLDQPAAVTALQLISDLVFKYQASPRPADLQDTNALNLFMTSRLGMLIDITGTASQVERQAPHFDWDLAHLPLGPKGRFTIVQGPSLSVFQASKQRDLAWQWTEFYTGKEIQQYAATVGRVVSARQSAAAAFKALPAPPANRAPLVDSAAFSRQRLFLTNWAQVNDVMTKNLDDSLTLGTKPAQQAAQAACQELTPLLTAG
jgi:multiple sugar transport system substrate-binding protein